MSPSVAAAMVIGASSPRVVSAASMVKICHRPCGVASFTVGPVEHDRSGGSSASWLHSRREKPTARHRIALWLLARLGGGAARLPDLALVRGALFFKWQSQLPQRQPHPPHTQSHMLGLFQLIAQFLERAVGLSANLPADPLLHFRGNPAYRSVPPDWSLYFSGASPT